MAFDLGTALDIGKLLLGGYGAYKSKDSLKYPDMPDMLSMEDLIPHMYQNFSGPAGDRTWSQDENGRWTQTFTRSALGQEMEDSLADVARNPYQAYTFNPKLEALYNATMDRRLGAGGQGGVIPREGYQRPQPRNFRQG